MSARLRSVCIVAVVLATACSRQPPRPGPALPRESPSGAEATDKGDASRDADEGTATIARSAAVDASSAEGGADMDPMATHLTTQADLLRHVWLPPAADARAEARRSALLAYLVETSPGHFNDGNPAIAHHAISRAACKAGLRGVVLQTDAERAQCGGAPDMVPIYTDGDPTSARACIDVFEFPNEPCELPFVWGSPSEAEAMCSLQGKRLCTQKEWSTACSADPEGKQPWAYAYGDTLDLAACNTSIPHETGPDGLGWRCNVHDAKTTWATCSTDTEPNGAFPRCRSRLGVYDQHGNVAEEMTRAEGGVVYTQLKGSAFFYVDVAREPGKAPLHPERESYPDTCNYDPRWHVEKLKDSLHVNYHLGFRCCKSL